MIKFKRLIAVIIALLGVHLHAQNGFWLSHSMKYPVGPDTLYYPFYNGEQMIEIDYVGLWEAKERYADMEWGVRDLARPTIQPEVLYNVYLFRNRDGRIVKAYNIRTSLDSLSLGFRKIPLDRMSTNGAVVRHKRQNTSYMLYYRGWSPNVIDGYYTVYGAGDSATIPFEGQPSTNSGLKVGLIDSLGNIFLPIEYSYIEPLNDHFIVYKDGHGGVIDRQKKIVLPMEYDRHEYVGSMEDVAFYKGDQIKVMYNVKSGQFKILEGYDWIDREWLGRIRMNPGSYAPLITVRNGAKCGLIDTNFNLVTPVIYDMCIPYFSQGLALVCRDNKFGYLDRNGKEVIPCVYTYAERFYGGLAVVQYQGKFMNIDSTGKYLKTNQREHEKWRDNQYTRYSIGKLTVVQSNTGSGLMDSNGVFVVPPIYENIIQMRTNENGRAAFSDTVFEARKFGRLGIVHVNGNVLLPFEYELINDYPTKYEFRIVKKDETHWGIINRRYELVLPPVYGGVSVGYDYDYFEFWQNGKAGTTDTTGKVIIPPLYTQIFQFENNRAMAQKDTMYGFIDRQGNVLIPFVYEQCFGKFDNGLCGIRQNGKWGFIDSTGKEIIAPQYEEVRRFQSEITGVKKDGKFGFINRQGKLVVPYQYEFVGWEWYFDGTVLVRQNGKLGFMNATGKIVIPIIYDQEWGSGPQLGHNLERNGKREWVKVE